MGILDGFEKGLERLVTGAFSKTFKSELQPIEIAAAIKADMDAKASVVSRDRILVPNSFTISLGNEDFKRMQSLGDTLIAELGDQIARHAHRQKFQLSGALSLKIVQDGALSLGQVHVTSNTADVQVQWTPVLDVAGTRFVLTKPRTTVGRDATADIQVDDAGLSRQHFEILWDGARGGLHDLGSTNGTKVNGRDTKDSALETESVISAGRSEFVFRVIAKTVTNE